VSEETFPGPFCTVAGTVLGSESAAAPAAVAAGRAGWGGFLFVTGNLSDPLTVALLQE